MLYCYHNLRICVWWCCSNTQNLSCYLAFVGYSAISMFFTVPCPFGMELVDNKCTECPIGSYTEKAGDACQPCGTGKTTLLTGSGSASECVGKEHWLE